MSQASADPTAKSENGLQRGEGVNILKKSFFTTTTTLWEESICRFIKRRICKLTSLNPQLVPAISEVKITFLIMTETNFKTGNFHFQFFFWRQASNLQTLHSFRSILRETKVSLITYSLAKWTRNWHGRFIRFSLLLYFHSAYQGPVDRSAAGMHANQADSNSKSLQITLMM